MKKYLIICLLVIPSCLMAQTAGDIDTSFHAGWFANDDVLCGAVQADGKILLGGNFTTFNHSSANKIVRLNPDFTVDETFKLITAPDYSILAIKPLPDGKVLIGGDFIYFGDDEYHHIARLNSDGSLDLSFNIGTGIGPLLGYPSYSSKVNQIELQPDNKILISGNFNEFDGYARSGIARLNYNGSIDLTFNPPATPQQYEAFELLADGKIFVGSSYLKRLNADGSLDATFVAPSTSGSIYDIQVMADGKIMIAGDFGTVNGYVKYDIARILADGSLDFSFFPDPVASYIYDIIITDDNKIITAGNLSVEKFNTDGTIDAGFTIGTASSTIFGIIKSGSNYIPFGYFTTYNAKGRNRVTAILSNGAIDASISVQNNGPGTESSIVHSIEVMGEEIYIGGDFNYFNGTSYKNLMRVDQSGNMDLTYIPPTTALLASTGAIYDIQAADATKILIGGSSSGGEKLMRLNHNGSKDVSFSAGTGFGTSDIVYCMDIQADGKYAIGGNINSYNGTTRGELLRLQNTGTYDANFSFCCVSYSIYSVDMQDDQKILVGGTFNQSGYSYKYFTRGTTAFANDADFIPTAYTGANSTVYKIIYNSDSSIYVFGDFTNVNTTLRNRICKLHYDGSVDNLFNPGSGANAIIRCAAVLPDGRILIGGDFTTYNDLPANHIACILTDGSLDMSFNSGLGANDAVYDIQIYDAYSAMIAGKFTSYNTSTCDNVTRIFYSVPLCFDVAVDYYDEICDGGNYTLLDGTIVTSPGVFTATGETALLCDSTVTYHLVNAPVYDYYVSAVIEDGEDYELPDGTFATTAGTYPVTLSSIYGCDSTIRTILIVIESCVPPASASVSMITSTSAKLSWSAVAAATKYQIWYKPSAAASWQKKSVTTTNKTLTGLLSNTTYQYKIKSICGAENSLFTPIQTFTTLPLKENNLNDQLAMQIYPNPNAGVFSIEIISSPEEINAVRIINMEGKIIYEKLTTSGILQIDESFPAGVYSVIISNISSTISKLIIISK